MPYCSTAKEETDLFYHQDQFIDIVTPDQAHLIAKVANQILDQNSKVFYGTMFSSGECKEFSTAQKRVDTHVCLGLQISMMGSLEKSVETVALDRPTKQDIERAQADRIKQLERQLATQGGRP
jgi:hypothetical protein